MKKYFVNINGSEKTNEIEILDNKTFLYDGNKYEYDTKSLSDNIMVLRINGNNYISKVEKDTEAEDNHSDIAFHVDIKSESYNVICKSELEFFRKSFPKEKAIKNSRMTYSPLCREQL